MTSQDHDVDRPRTTLLIERARQQDEEALSELMDRYMPLIRHWVRDNAGPAVRARFETMDCIQDVVLQLLRYLPSVKIEDTEVFRRILYRMIQNSLRGKYEYLMACRRRMSLEQPLAGDTMLDLDPPDPDAPTPSQVVHNQERAAWLRLALPLLEPDQQELILSHKVEGKTFVTIGEERGESPDAVRMRFKRAMVKLSSTIGRLRRGEVRELVDDEGAEA